MPYLLAKLQCRYGKIPELVEIMQHLTPILESRGWRLHGAYTCRIGCLNRVYDLWEIESANDIGSVLELARQDPEFRQWAARLGECVEHEDLELLNQLPYAHLPDQLE